MNSTKEAIRRRADARPRPAGDRVRESTATLRAWTPPAPPPLPPLTELTLASAGSAISGGGDTRTGSTVF